jgi:hypothetical protein
MTRSAAFITYTTVNNCHPAQPVSDTVRVWLACQNEVHSAQGSATPLPLAPHAHSDTQSHAVKATEIIVHHSHANKCQPQSICSGMLHTAGRIQMPLIHIHAKKKCQAATCNHSSCSNATALPLRLDKSEIVRPANAGNDNLRWPSNCGHTR